MEKEIPKIDLPEEWVIGTGINIELLSLYTNYPVRLKCEMFVLCMDGKVEASVNLNHITVKANDFISLTPGSIFQINSVEGNLKIYFLGFSSQYIKQTSQSRNILDAIYFSLGRPVISLRQEGAKILENYFQFLIKMYEYFPAKLKSEISPNLYADIHKGYAQQLGISHAHLCTTVKHITGKTCIDIISSMVIMDAKSQLKSTNLSIQDISDSLNFANMSFFGKYFKRYVGMSPLEYRNNG